MPAPSPAKTKALQQGKALLEKMKKDPTLEAKINAATSYSAFLGVAKGAGFDISALAEEEARALARGDTGAVGELSDADLEQVAGGWGNVTVNMNNW